MTYGEESIELIEWCIEEEKKIDRAIVENSVNGLDRPLQFKERELDREFWLRFDALIKKYEI